MILGQLRMGERQMTSAPLSPDNPRCYVHLWCRFYNILYLNNKQKIGEKKNEITFHIWAATSTLVFSLNWHKTAFGGEKLQHVTPPATQARATTFFRDSEKALCCNLWFLSAATVAHGQKWNCVTAYYPSTISNPHLYWMTFPKDNGGQTKYLHFIPRAAYIYVHAPYDRI